MQTPASLQARFFAKFIDIALCLLFSVLIVALEKQFLTENYYFSNIVWISTLLLIDGVNGGQSPGKKFLKIQILTKKNGLPCGYLRSVFRNFSLINFVLVLPGFIELVFLSSNDRRIGDYIAGTIVINKPTLPTPID